jgi:ABC-type lipoprotein export system ATPase subunit
MIRTQNLSYTYKSSKALRFPDFNLPAGQPCLLLGESGSGKTTLLHLLSGVLRSQRGDIIVNGTDVSKLKEADLDRFRGQFAGFVFQKNHLINALTVKQNLLMVPFLARTEQDTDRVEQVLQQLGILEVKNANIKNISQGQAQRVAIARAIINKPMVIFADEPTSALDDRNCDKVIELLLDAAHQNNSTLVIATHDQRLKSKINYQINLLPYTKA